MIRQQHTAAPAWRPCPDYFWHAPLVVHRGHGPPKPAAKAMLILYCKSIPCKPSLFNLRPLVSVGMVPVQRPPLSSSKATERRRLKRSQLLRLQRRPVPSKRPCHGLAAADLTWTRTLSAFVRARLPGLG